MKILQQLLFLCVLISMTCIIACIQPPDYPDEPIIEFVGLNQNTIAQGSSNTEDTLVITFAFTDGDGNIGNDSKDTTEDGRPFFNVFKVDSRDGTESTNRIPIIPEQGTGNGISGEVSISFPNSEFCCIFDDRTTCRPALASEAPTDTFTYTIHIVDRDGNVSNEIETAPIILLCN